jgi:homopolymeric O-antigen transport system ATP-binding protein
MSATTMIEVERVAKRYEVGVRRDSYGTARDAVAGAVVRTARRAARLGGGRPGAKREGHWIWALEDVSFQIPQGDVVGIIGRNGAGKSTLLKILSRITEPTSGRAVLWGRVGSLLEVGTGFHGELSGRENVYLNGAILGMRKREIDRRFDEIVEFAEVNKFLDTPVKRYSSGMMVRLAFAVAAHLEPEILLVDEILAVGDAGFQKKCLGKMSDVAGEGRTVLFVSHNMAVVQALCKRGIVLQDGKVVLDAPVEDAAAYYLRMLDQASESAIGERTDRRGHAQVVVDRIEIVGEDGVSGALATGGPVRFTFRTSTGDQRVSCSFTIYNQLGHPVARLDSGVRGPEDLETDERSETFVCEIDELTLVPGRYRLDVTLWGRHGLEDQVEGAAFFDVEQGTLAGRPVSGHGSGDMVIRHRWLAPSID